MKKLMILTLTVIAITLTSCFQDKQIKGIAISHSTSSDILGGITYHSVISTTDGFLRDEEGIQMYSVPVNTSVIYYSYR